MIERVGMMRVEMSEQIKACRFFFFFFVGVCATAERMCALAFFPGNFKASELLEGEV